MALKFCNECGHKVSTKADKCPNCGAPLPKKSGCLSTLSLLAVGVVVLLLILAQGEKTQKKKGPISSSQKTTQSELPTTPPPGNLIKGEPEKENLKTPVLIPSYEVVSEELYDALVKTQVVQHIAVSGDLTQDNLKALLMQRYNQIMKRRGFKYHEKPTNVFLYLYENAEKAGAEQGLWLAMLEMVAFRGGKPKTTVRTEQFARLGKKPIMKFGLSESTRQEIYRKSFEIEDKANAEAEEKEPTNIQKQMDLISRLIEKFKMEFAEKYHLTREQLDLIGTEGFMNLWIGENPPKKADVILHDQKIGLSYDEVMAHFSEFFSMEQSTLADGQNRFMGQTTDKLALFEIIGDSDNIFSASLLTAIPKDAPYKITRNSALLLLFLKNVAPSWAESEQWAIESMKKVGANPSNSQKIILGNKAIKMHFYQPLGMVMVTVEHS